MSWRYWYESGKILGEKGHVVYKYDYRDNEKDGICVGLFPEITEAGKCLACFPENWKEGQVAVKQWYELQRGDVGGQQVCNCGRHVASWSVGQGIIDLLERTLIVYEIDEEIAKAIMSESGSWYAYYDLELRQVIEEIENERRD